jgi:hypothetical protein
MAGLHTLFFYCLSAACWLLLIFGSLTLIHVRENSSTRLSMYSALGLRSSRHISDENFGRGAHHTRKKRTPLPAREPLVRPRALSLCGRHPRRPRQLFTANERGRSVSLVHIATASVTSDVYSENSIQAHSRRRLLVITKMRGRISKGVPYFVRD